MFVVESSDSRMSGLSLFGRPFIRFGFVQFSTKSFSTDFGDCVFFLGE